MRDITGKQTGVHDLSFGSDHTLLTDKDQAIPVQVVRNGLRAVAFGAGTRVCVGEQFAWTEAVLVLATLGRGWELDRVSADPVHLRPGVTLRPAGETGMRLVRRGA